MQEQEATVTTSESDVETHSKVLVSEKFDSLKELEKEKPNHRTISRKSSLAVSASISAAASAGLISMTIYLFISLKRNLKFMQFLNKYFDLN